MIAEVGSDVTDLKKGDLVAYAMIPGAYAELAAVRGDKLVKLPEGLDARAGEPCSRA